jgi:hypothetical protein
MKMSSCGRGREHAQVNQSEEEIKTKDMHVNEQVITGKIGRRRAGGRRVGMNGVIWNSP